jgi:hypothetical protein
MPSCANVAELSWACLPGPDYSGAMREWGLGRVRLPHRQWTVTLSDGQQLTVWGPDTKIHIPRCRRCRQTASVFPSEVGGKVDWWCAECGNDPS